MKSTYRWRRAGRPQEMHAGKSPLIWAHNTRDWESLSTVAATSWDHIDAKKALCLSCYSANRSHHLSWFQMYCKPCSKHNRFQQEKWTINEIRIPFPLFQPLFAIPLAQAPQLSPLPSADPLSGHLHFAPCCIYQQPQEASHLLAASCGKGNQPHPAQPRADYLHDLQPNLPLRVLIDFLVSFEQMG